MDSLQLEPGTRATILVHYYRAMVGRADIWRMRMDTTTHWAIGATAAVASFALGNAAVPHYVVHIASFLTVIFLLLEARRLTFYHLWQSRVLDLERTLVAPALADETTTAADLPKLEDELGPELGTTIPTMSMGKAAARRLRRVYVYLFAVQGLAWLMKLATHPEPAQDAGALVARASIGAVPGAVTLGLGAAGLAFAVGLAVARGGVSRRSVQSA